MVRGDVIGVECEGLTFSPGRSQAAVHHVSPPFNLRQNKHLKEMSLMMPVYRIETIKPKHADISYQTKRYSQGFEGFHSFFCKNWVGKPAQVAALG